jgi:hypothetical protein
VKAIYHQLSIEPEKYIERCRDKAEKYLFHSTTLDRRIGIWSERYFLFYKLASFDSSLREIDVFDSFNNKTM